MSICSCDSNKKSATPSQAPTAAPTEVVTAVPTAAPTEVVTAVPTKKPAPKPTAKPTPAPTAEPTFFNDKTGTWSEVTNDFGGKFIEISADKKSMALMVRNAGGIFPGGNISNVVTTGNSCKFNIDVAALDYTVDGELLEHFDAYTLHCSAEMKDANTMVFSCDEEPTWNATYAKDLTLTDFIKKYNGTYTALEGDNIGNFVYFTADNTAGFGVWCAGGDFPVGKITGFAAVDYMTYEFRVNAKSGDINVYLDINNDKNLTIDYASNGGNSVKAKYTFVDKYQFPNPKEEFDYGLYIG